MKHWLQVRRARKFNRWFRYGVKNGLCTDQFCLTHDVQPMSDQEADAWDEGHDPCCHVVRLGQPEDWSY